MKIFHLTDMKEGWYIGNFVPSVLQTHDFEVGFKKHLKDEIWPKHYHKEAMEINLIISGTMKANNVLLKSGDIFILDKMETIDPTFLEDCWIVCVKVPSVLGDKYIVER